jgi:hypothetical protein
MTRRLLSFLVLVVASAWLSAQSPPMPVAVPRVVMEDQFERRQDIAALRGQIVVLIYGDRKSADANKHLGELLHVHFHPTARGLPPAEARRAPVKPVASAAKGRMSPEVQTIPVACIGRVPAVVKKLIAGQFRKASPDVPVWLDFDDQMRRDFEFAPGVPNVAIFDVHGRYRHYAAGVATPAMVQELASVIESLRAAAVR